MNKLSSLLNIGKLASVSVAIVLDWDDYYMISNLFDEQTIPHFQQQKSVSLPLISQSSLTSNTVKTETEKQDAEELTLDLNIQATNVSETICMNIYLFKLNKKSF